MKAPSNQWQTAHKGAHLMGGGVFWVYLKW